LHLDGTPVEASALEPFFASKVRILGAVAVPIAVAAGVIFLLATFRLSIAGLYRSVVDTGRRTR
jgi:Na+/glutamate symporter